MLYQIKRNTTNAFLNLLNLNSDIIFLHDTYFAEYAIAYDIYEVKKASIYLNKFNINYSVISFNYSKIGKNKK